MINIAHSKVLFLFLFVSILTCNVFALSDLEEKYNAIIKDEEQLNLIRNGNTVDKIGLENDPLFINNKGRVTLKNGRNINKDNVAIGDGIISITGNYIGEATVTLKTPMPNTSFSVKYYPGITADKQKVRDYNYTLYDNIVSDSNGDVTYKAYSFSTQILDFPSSINHNAGGELTTYYLNYFFSNYDRVRVTINNGTVANPFQCYTKDDPSDDGCAYSDVYGSENFNKFESYFGGSASNPRLRFESKNYAEGFQDYLITIQAFDSVNDNQYVSDSIFWNLESSESAAGALPTQLQVFPNRTVNMDTGIVIFLNDYFEDYNETFMLINDPGNVTFLTASKNLFDCDSHVTDKLSFDICGFGDEVRLHIVSKFDKLSYVINSSVSKWNGSALNYLYFDWNYTVVQSGDVLYDNIVRYDDAEIPSKVTNWTQHSSGLAVGTYNSSVARSGTSSYQTAQSSGTFFNRDSWNHSVTYINFTFDMYVDTSVSVGNSFMCIASNRNTCWGIGDNHAVGVGRTTSGVNFSLSVGGNTKNTIIPLTNGWHNIKIIKEGSGAHIYIDDVFVSTEVVNLTFPNVYMTGYKFSNNLQLYDNMYIINGSLIPIPAQASSPLQLLNFGNVSLEQDEQVYFDFDDYFADYDRISISYINPSSELVTLNTSINSSVSEESNIYYNLSLQGNNNDVKLYITTKLRNFNTTITINAYNEDSQPTLDTFGFSINEFIITENIPTQINELETITIGLQEQEFIHFGAFFDNYQGIILEFIDPVTDDNVIIDTELFSNSSFYIKPYIGISVITENNDLVMYIDSQFSEFYTVFTVTPYNAYGEIEDFFALDINGDTVGGDTPIETETTSFSKSIIRYLNSFFPHYTTITLSERYMYVLVIIILTLLLIIGFAYYTGVSNFSVVGLISVILIATEISYFVSIKYIPIIVVILIGLLGIGIGYILFKSGFGDS